MRKRSNLKKGFSLLETVIALTIVALIFALATTVIISTVGSRRYSEVKRFFIYETQNYLECYKRGGKEGFNSNLQNLLGITAKSQTSASGANIYTVYYSKSLEYLDAGDSEFQPDGAFFKIIVRDKTDGKTGFYLTVIEIEENKEVYKTQKEYVSRYDIQS